MSTETGGCAFPYSGVHKGEKENQIIDSHGMTLRDYFAAKSLQAFLSNPSIMKTAERADKKKVAECAYDFADAMLAARGQ